MSIAVRLRSLFPRESQVPEIVRVEPRGNRNSQGRRGPEVFPFPGRKDSAEGTLPVTDALRAFSIRTRVAAKEGDPNRDVLTRIVRERRSKFLSTDFVF